MAVQCVPWGPNVASSEYQLSCLYFWKHIIIAYLILLAFFVRRKVPLDRFRENEHTWSWPLCQPCLAQFILGRNKYVGDVVVFTEHWKWCHYVNGRDVSGNHTNPVVMLVKIWSSENIFCDVWLSSTVSGSWKWQCKDSRIGRFNLASMHPFGNSPFIIFSNSLYDFFNTTLNLLSLCRLFSKFQNLHACDVEFISFSVTRLKSDTFNFKQNFLLPN